MDRRIAAGFDLFSKQSDNTRYSYYENTMTGGTLRVGLPLTDESFGSAAVLAVPAGHHDPEHDRASRTTTAGIRWRRPIPSTYPACLYNGEASLALKEAQGKSITSLVGYTLTYNTLDNTRNPRSGFYAEIKQDFAGLGGDSQLHPHHG